MGLTAKIEGEPRERVATVGPSSFSPSSWYYKLVSFYRYIQNSRGTYTDVVFLHVAQEEQLVEALEPRSRGQHAGCLGGQGFSPSVHYRFSSPLHALEGLQDKVRGFVEWGGLHGGDELVRSPLFEKELVSG